MKKNFPALSATAMAVIAAFSVGSVSAANVSAAKVDDAKFAQYLEQQKPDFKKGATDQFIVHYKQSASFSGKGPEVAGRLVARNLAAFTKRGISFKKSLGEGKHVLKLDKMMSKKEQDFFLRSIRQDKNVEFVEMDPVRYLMSQSTPWGIPRVQADQLSDTDAGNMKVCIIDSGYEQTNPDLSANNATGTNDSGTGNWYQAGGSHGTHVAGTIAGVNNSEGVVGVLPNTNVNLHIIKVFNASGWGYSSDLASAVNACASAGSKVVNMSLGGSGSSTTERNALESVTNSGVLLLAASGNDGNSTLSYPASYDTVMAVGATDSGNKHAEFSQYTAQVEIAAPGEAVLSTVAGDGRLGTITVGSSTYGNGEGVVPHMRYVPSGSSFTPSDVNGSASGTLASCTLSGGSYSCSSNVNNNICVVERNGNQAGSNYPENAATDACMDAGAKGVIVYSNTERTGLQNPFLVDRNSKANVPTVSVDRATGLDLMGKLGQSTTINVVANQNYAYYNGTSMATPHAAGVAALVWANNITCSNTDVRNALKATAIDLETAGRDDKTGYGLVQAKAASDHLANNCGGGTTPPPTGNTLENGVAKTGLSGASGEELKFTMDVPAGATNITFTMSGGTGDADLYTRFGSAPTTSTYDCRPYKSGNSESCTGTTAGGTYHVMVRGYSAFSGVSLTGSYTEGSSGGGGVTPIDSTVNDISVSRNAWKRYTLDLGAGYSDLTVQMSGGSGDADLYVNHGSQSSTSNYDCRPYKSGNNETCNFTNPASGTWYIDLNGYRAASGVTLNVTAN